MDYLEPSNCHPIKLIAGTELFRTAKQYLLSQSQAIFSTSVRCESSPHTSNPSCAQPKAKPQAGKEENPQK